MKRLLAPVLILIALVMPGQSAQERPMVAFGYLSNETPGEKHKYIGIIFPKSFASSIAAYYDVTVKNPLELEEILGKSGESLKKNYSHYELPELADKIRAHVFIYGNYAVMPENRIRISLHLFVKGANEIFTFTSVGKMETDISRMVDRVSVIIMNFFESNSLYRSDEISPGKRIGILTNLDNYELNRLYGVFMKNNYPVSAFQGNHLNTYITDDSMEPFKYMRTDRNSFSAITDWRKTKIPYGTWGGQEQKAEILRVRKIYEVFDVNYGVLKEKTLARMGDAFSGKLDYLMVIGFDSARSNAWVRCLDVSAKDFVWMQSGYRRGPGDPVESIAEKIISSMTAPVKNPFKQSVVSDR